MITLPTPLYITLLCLAPFGAMALFCMLLVAFLFARVEHEEWQKQQQARRAHAQLFRSIDEYLQKVGGN